MAREIILNLGNEQSTFSFEKVDRKDLYGYKKREFLDQNDLPCQKGMLDVDDGSLLKSGYLSSCYVTEKINYVEKDDLADENEKGENLKSNPSTLGQPQSLKEVEVKQILNAGINSVYGLSAQSLGSNLKKALEEGKVYHFAFNYYQDFHLEDAFLVKNENGIFALIGNIFQPEWSESTIIRSEVIDDLDGEIDFEMMQ